jgi:hypothetical protein
MPELPGEDPDSRAARLERAMDAVIALHPDDAFETDLAVRIVSTGAHAADALHSATLADGDPDTVRQCRAQAASMIRQSDSALRNLLRIQARRQEQEADSHPAHMRRSGYWFKEVSVPATDPVPHPAPEYERRPAPAEPQPAPEPTRDIDADARLYAAMYPDRVKRIIKARGLPPSLDFGPPEPEIVAALLRSVVRSGNLVS